MWDKKIVVTKHAMLRFEQRNIKFSTKNFNPIHQILIDLKPLNVRTKERLKDNNYKIETNQGKVYIIREEHDATIVKTVYKNHLKYKNNYCRKVCEHERKIVKNNQ